MLFKRIVVPLLILQVDVVEISVEESVGLDVLRVGLNLVEACLVGLILALQCFNSFIAATDLMLVGLLIAVDEQFLGVEFILSIVEFKFTVLPTLLKTSSVLKDRLFSILVLA